jgi:competence protein ComEA
LPDEESDGAENGFNPPSSSKDWQEFFNNTQKIIGLFTIFLFITGAFVLSVLRMQTKTAPEMKLTGAVEETAEEASISAALLTVQLSGAVNKPGVFTVPADSRIQDLLQLGEGLASAGDPSWVERNINLAEKLFDGEKVYIPTRAETAATTTAPNVVGYSGQSVLGTKSAKININTAAVPALDTLPGIGPSTAGKIIEYRQKNGPFARIEDIQKVGGIKSALFNKIKDLITVN